MLVNGGEFAALHQRPGIDITQHWPVADDLVGKRSEPAEQCRLPAGAGHFSHLVLDQRRRALGVAPGERMVDCLGRRPIALEPLAGAAVERGDLLGLLGR